MEIFQCRLCDGSLKTVLDLGNLYISGFVDEAESRETEPLTLAVCNRCGFAQLKHIVDPDRMYRQYWYKSSLNQSMVEALKDIVVSSVSRWNGRTENPVALDIGANDGTMLAMYPGRFFTIGYDPALNLREEAEKNCNAFINDYFTWKNIHHEWPVGIGRADIVTAIAMFYDLNDPGEFLENVRAAMREDGVFVIQMTDMISMLKANAFDNICFLPGTQVSGKRIEDIKDGDTIYDSQGNKTQVITTMTRPYDGTVLEINAMYVEKLTCTPEHPILTVPKESVRFDCGQLRKSINPEQLEPVWIHAEDIKPGDMLAIPRIKPTKTTTTIDLMQYNSNSPYRRRGLESVELDTDMAWFIGLYVAEGFSAKLGAGNEYICLTLHEKETYFVDRVIHIFEKLGYRVTVYDSTVSKAISVRIYCTALARYLRGVVGHGARNKRVPQVIINHRNEEIKTGFLRGLVDGDGYIDGNQVHLHTGSRALAQDVQFLVASLGAAVGITKAKNKKRVCRNGTIRGSVSWQVRGASGKLAQIFGYTYLGSGNHTFVSDDFVFVRVKSVKEKEYSGQVHNLETESHTYTAANVAVHNCHEHAGYYTLVQMIKLLNEHGFHVFDVERNMVNGGSVRIYAAKDKELYEISPTVLVEIGREARYMESYDDPFLAFALRVINIGLHISRFMLQTTGEGVPIFALGASTKGNTLLQYFGLDRRTITAIGEVNEDKFGKRTVGTSIPIVPETTVLKSNPPILMILPWHFRDFFVKKLWGLMEEGTELLFPLPEPELVSVRNGEMYIENLLSDEGVVPWAR